MYMFSNGIFVARSLDDEIEKKKKRKRRGSEVIIITIFVSINENILKGNFFVFVSFMDKIKD